MYPVLSYVVFEFLEVCLCLGVVLRFVSCYCVWSVFTTSCTPIWSMSCSSLREVCLCFGDVRIGSLIGMVFGQWFRLSIVLPGFFLSMYDS